LRPQKANTHKGLCCQSFILYEVFSTTS